MVKDELATQFDELQKKIKEKQQKGDDVTELLYKKIELLSQAYDRLYLVLQDEKYNRNPRKYSTLVSYLNTIKGVQLELGLSTDETEVKIHSVENQMRKSGLGWILDGKVEKVIK